MPKGDERKARKCGMNTGYIKYCGCLRQELLCSKTLELELRRFV